MFKNNIFRALNSQLNEFLKSDFWEYNIRDIDKDDMYDLTRRIIGYDVIPSERIIAGKKVTTYNETKKDDKVRKTLLKEYGKSLKLVPKSEINKISKGINDYTAKLLTKAIYDNLEKDDDELKSYLRKTMKEKQKSRSKAISITEETNIKSREILEKSEKPKKKRWINMEDDKVCKDCKRNTRDGWISMNKSFSGGVMFPAQHPFCRCILQTSSYKFPKIR